MAVLQQNSVFYALLMTAAGIGIPIMAALNAGLGGRLQNPTLATTILFFVAMAASISFMLLFEGIPRAMPKAPIPFYYYLGGLFVVFYVLSITWVAPKFGIGNAISFVLLGQLISMAVIDHFGLFSAAQVNLSIQRTLGLALMAIGVFLAVRR